jgi:RND family efflux transporter MFP subunit
MTQAPETKPKKSKNLWWLAIALLLVGLGVVPRVLRQHEITAKAQFLRNGALKVNVVKPSGAPQGDLKLPGNIEAIRDVAIYARTSGYLKTRLVDIGERVKAGQLLATIESPEVDQELSQAKADQAQAQAAAQQAKANRDLAKTTLARSKALKQEQLISQQNLDEKQANYNARVADYQAALATVNSQWANVKRLKALQGYQQIKAPFAGIVTKRNLNIDVGALIASDSSSANQELFRLAQTDQLRIRINVPQSSALDVKEGQAVKVIVPELAQKPFSGKIKRSAQALEQTSRTLLIEIILQNNDNQLLPGAYAQVIIPSSANVRSSMVIPANALVLRTAGPMVAVIDANNRVRYTKVELGRDYGTEIEVASGLKGNELLVVNPSDDINEGRKVEPVLKQKEKTN